MIGGGTVGAWCAYFLRRSGLDRVVLVEKRTLGQGASSRAAGVVRTQGGTPWAVQLGEWCRRFYLGQHDELGIDSGFTPQGYVLPCFTEADVTAARERMAMQNSLGLNVRWLEPGQLDSLNPTLAPGQTLGGTYCAEDGYLTPPRNVTAYAVALAVSGVEVRERASFTGLDVTGGAVTGVRTSAGPITTPLVVLTGGPELAEVGGLAGVPSGGRGPAPGRGDRAASRPRARPGADGVRPVGRAVLAAGGGRPAVRDEQPGRAARRGGLRGRALPGADAPAPGRTGAGHRRLGLRRMWAATIDYTPDHLPIIGPAIVRGRDPAMAASPWPVRAARA